MSSTIWIKNYKDRNKMTEPGTLIKFGQQEHIIQLRDEGLLHLNNLPYFWEIEDKELRGDPFDGVDEVARGHIAKFTFPEGKEVTLEGNWTIRMHPFEPERIKIFCMYALRPLIGSFPVNEKNFQFGDYALVLIKPQEFIDRIALTLKAQGIKGKADLVEYVDDEYAGKVGPFKKLKRFSYQSEWRLVCFDGPGKTMTIRIGSIRDISTIIRSDEVNSKIKIVPELGGAPDL